jgi:hypothetical protein
VAEGDLSEEQAAAAMRVSENALRRHLAAARTALRGMLARGGHGAAGGTDAVKGRGPGRRPPGPRSGIPVACYPAAGNRPAIDRSGHEGYVRREDGALPVGAGSCATQMSGA